MKESQWRSKLIALRRKTNPNDFIWAMDAKFKAGFPDLYILNNGIPIHIELKIGKFYTANWGLAPIQLKTLRDLRKAKAQSFCLNLEYNGHVGITEIGINFDSARLCLDGNFFNKWISPTLCLGTTLG